MNRDDFKTIGEEVFGQGWQTALARHSNIQSRNVRRYVAGDSPVPDWLASELLYLKHAQHVDDAFAQQLAEACDDVAKNFTDGEPLQWPEGIFDSVAALGPEGEYPIWIAIRSKDLVWLCQSGEVVAVGIWDAEHEKIMRPRLIVSDDELAALSNGLAGVA